MPDLEVALFRTRYTAQDSKLKPDAPPWHKGFSFSNQTTEVIQTSVFINAITFQLENERLDRDKSWHYLINRNEIWELWKDEQGRFIFFNRMQPLLRQLTVDADFTKGLLVGNFLEGDRGVCYPLPQDLEIVFYVNWLGKLGDLVLHASGIAVDGKGYAFAGSSGVGKSTLARKLNKNENVTMLGEDQLVLRFLDNRFWIFGTPWHEDPLLCSPIGVPLEKLYFLEKNGINAKIPVTPMEGVTRLLQTAFIPYYRPEVVSRILERLDILAETVAMCKLSYSLDGDVEKLIFA